MGGVTPGPTGHDGTYGCRACPAFSPGGAGHGERPNANTRPGRGRGLRAPRVWPSNSGWLAGVENKELVDSEDAVDALFLRVEVGIADLG